MIVSSILDLYFFLRTFVYLHLCQTVYQGTGAFVARTLSFESCSFNMVDDIMSVQGERIFNDAAVFWYVPTRVCCALNAWKRALSLIRSTSFLPSLPW